MEGIRFWSFGDVTRIAIETTGEYKLYSETIEKPERVFFDLIGLAPPSAAERGMQVITVGDHRIRQIRVAGLSDSKTRIVFDLDSSVEVLSSQLVNPDRLMIEIRPKGAGLPSLAAGHSVVGSRKVDLAAHGNAAIDKDIIETELSASKTVSKPLNKDPGSNKEPVVSNKDIVINKDPVPNRDPVSSRDTASSRETTSNKDITSYKDTGSSKDKKDREEPKNDPADAYHPSRSSPVVQALSSPLPSPVVTTLAPPVTASLATDIATTTKPPAPTPNGIATAKNDSSGDRSLVRILGLKLGKVVIDAGHGGHDSGTVGPNGLMEKELVLDVALRLGAMITKQMGAEVVYTRSTDVFIPLEQRTQIANEQKADLFISVHANSSSEPSASGVETYYFNLTSDRGGLDLATRENASADSSISDLNDLLHRAVLQTKREESREFAQKIQTSLCASAQKTGNRPVDRGVRQAPFVVLIGATMPSILAEIGFVSNPRDEKLLRHTDERKKIAEALLKGVVQYANSLSHVQIARAGAE